MLFAVLALLTSLYADINSNDVKLSLMGDLEGRSMIIKVKDKQGNKLGVFKPNSGSTLYRGEYASYKLAVMTGLKDLYPETEIQCMSIETQKKVKDLIANISFEKDYGETHEGHMTRKEENRKILLQEIDRNIEKKEPLCGAFKKWINNLQFYYSLGTLQNLVSHPIIKLMQATGPQPLHKKFTIKQCTELFDPKGCYFGDGYIDEMAKDMSSIMLLDAVLGNSDRFPGGNVHFRSLKGNMRKVGNKFYFGRSRLFSLDNGAVLRPKDSTALDDLEATEVTRFQKPVVEALRKIKEQSKDQNLTELKLSPEEYQIFISNLERTLKYIDTLEAKYKKAIWFKD